jgi:DNA-binding GntR family transcriptional regulator
MASVKSKKESVSELLLRRLTSGHYRLGQRILVKELQKETGASRQPIMGALSDLRSQGFVTIEAKVGCQVISPTPREVDDFFRMFAQMDGFLGELAAERRLATEVVQLRKINEQIKMLRAADPRSGALYATLNRKFHGAIRKMAKSPAVAERQAITVAMVDFLIEQTHGFQSRMETASEEHDEIIDHIARGNAAQVRRCIERHIAGTRISATAGLPRAPIPAKRAGSSRGIRAGTG